MIDLRSLVAAMRVLVRGGLARYAVDGVSEVSRFEQELCRAIGVRHALGVNSGTSALICALVAARIGPGDDVLVPAYTWVSSAAAAIAVGAMPVLVEIDQSLTIDPADLQRKVTPRTKAIIPVHMLNLVCDMDAIMRTASEHQLLVVEDACQAVGLTWRNMRVGSIGQLGVFSFQQNKNIHAGEGGAVLTNDDRLYARANMYHDVGSFIREGRVQTDEPLLAGVNYRMPEVAAAILRPQLRTLDAKLAKMRRRRAYVLDRLRGSRFRFQVCPHHDAASAVGLAVFFDHEDEARDFAAVAGITRLIDTGRHVYTNWETIRTTVDIGPDACPRTLDILRRTCTINLVPDLPMAAYRLAVRRMVR